MIHLVICLVLTFTSMTCQGISNGNFECQKDGRHSSVKHFNACKNATYISSDRLELTVALKKLNTVCLIFLKFP